VERCAALLHLVDGTQEDVAAAYKIVRRELKAYGGGLGRKKEIVALNKCDALDDKTRKKKLAALSKACRKTVHELSGVSGEGRDEMIAILARLVQAARRDETEAKAAKNDERWAT
jgi:GTPase